MTNALLAQPSAHSRIAPAYPYAPILGGSRGFNTAGDILTQTADGRDLNALWDEFQQTVQIHNERRQVIIDALTFPVTNVIEDVGQMGGDDFEEASEFGEPKSIRTTLTYFSLAYDFKWYDIANRYTWQFLADASASQVEAVHQQVLDADNRNVFSKVMRALFNSSNRASTIKGQNYTVFALYNGDGTVPPEYKGNTFNGQHTHYFTSGNTVLDSGDLEDLIQKLAEHGYTAANGTELHIMMNSAQTKIVRTFRANVANNNGAVATYDFIPATNQPALIVPNPQGLLGTQPSPSSHGLTVIGSYGNAFIHEEDYIPAGYVLIFGSGGEGSLNNPVGIREHANPALRGLRLLAGNQQGYPLTESFYQRGFGTGIRQRGGAAVLQLTANATYTTPAAWQ